MRGIDLPQGHVFSYLSAEQRVRKDHPLRPIRALVDQILKRLSRSFDTMYAKVGCPSIPPEQLLRALLLQMLYSVRSERLLAQASSRVPSTEKYSSEVQPCSRAWKGAGKEAKLSYSGNPLVENRHDFIVQSCVWEATGIAERSAALEMLQEISGDRRVTVGGDKRLDTTDFVRECRHLHVTPHVAQNLGRRGGSAIDRRTTRHAGYTISQKNRKPTEECFGWLKTIALFRKVRHRGTLKVDWNFTLASAVYNLVRMRNLMAATVPAQ
jgi:hypothetical protein